MGKRRCMEVWGSMGVWVHTPSNYSAGDFSKSRITFIAALRAHGVSYYDANAKWVRSSMRERLLEGMTDSERKRRRM